jgi:hypothetical protein
MGVSGVRLVLGSVLRERLATLRIKPTKRNALITALPPLLMKGKGIPLVMKEPTFTSIIPNAWKHKLMVQPVMINLPMGSDA